MTGEDEDEYDYPASFTYGECTCDHDPDQHGWVKCDEPGCPCEAAWEE